MRRVILLLVLVALLVCGCAMHHQREQLREGVLEYRMHRKAILTEWGPPDRITSTESKEYIDFPSSGQQHNFSFPRLVSPGGPLEVWIYERYGVALVLKGRRLVGWKTDKTPADLKALAGRSK